MVDKKTLCALLDAWIQQRPGLEFGNYGDWTAYRSEMRSITRDLHHARAMLRYVEWHDSITADMILDAAKSGRLSIKVEGDKVSLDYCTGQYWPTEYRPAVCRLLSSAIWYWMRENMPKPVHMHNSETGECVDRIDGLRIGDYLRRMAGRELGTSIARRWFA
jgi:hypothetical protein